MSTCLSQFCGGFCSLFCGVLIFVHINVPFFKDNLFARCSPMLQIYHVMTHLSGN